MTAQQKNQNAGRNTIDRWPADIIVLGIIAIPAFSGYPLGRWPFEIMPGVLWSDALYCGLVLTATRLLLGKRMFSAILAVAALVTLPVVFAGGTLSWVAAATGLSRQSFDAIGTHYVKLSLTMLTVVPLALGMVATVPFDRFEQGLMLNPQGVTPGRKKILMVLRVFNHIAFGVLPATLEIVREEQMLAMDSGGFGQRGDRGGMLVRRTIDQLIFLAVGIICAALQYIPLWAYEIGRLPESPPDQ